MLNSARHACSQLKRVGSSCAGRKDTESQQPCLGENAVQRHPVTLTEVKQGEEMGNFDMVKVDMPIPSPVSGVIEEINEELESNLWLLHSDFYGEGWLALFRLTDFAADRQNLMDAEAYRAMLEGKEDMLSPGAGDGATTCR